MLSSVLIDGRRRSYITAPGYRQGMKPANAGRKFPAEVLSRDEIDRLMGALGRGHAGARNRALVVVMWRSGLRVAEALALHPKDIDLAAGTITVLHGKGDRRRVVGVDEEAGAHLRVWFEHRRQLGLTSRHPVFCVISRPTLGKPMYSSTVREALKDAGERAGIAKRIHPHGLRHTFASDCAREGVPLPFIQMMLGHKDLATTSRYLASLSPWEAINAMRARSWTPAAVGAADLPIAAA